MEAKGGEGKDADDEKPEGAGGGPPQVVINLLNFAMKVVHEEMAGFFEKHCDMWDYEEKEMKAIMAGSGETLQQHAVFQDYLEVMNGHLDKFASASGYASARDVFDAVEAAVEHDKVLRKKMMAEMNAMFAQMKRQLTFKKPEAKEEEAKEEEKGEEKEEAKDAEDEAKEDKAEAAPEASRPLMLFSQPIGLEYLLESVLNLAEYETFRMMMIMKLEERGRKRRALAADRASDLVEGCSSKVVCEQYAMLKKRLAAMTPHRKDLHDELDAKMDTAKFDDDAGRSSADPEAYAYALEFLLRVSAPNVQEELQTKSDELKASDASDVAYLLVLHGHIDAVHNNIENCMLAARRDPITGGAADAKSSGAKD